MMRTAGSPPIRGNDHTQNDDGIMLQTNASTNSEHIASRLQRPTTARAKRWLPGIVFGLTLTVLAVCGYSNANLVQAQTPSGVAWFPKFDPVAFAAQPHINFIAGLNGYQQTTEYTCGPAALLAVAKYYKRPGIQADAATEMRIAREVGTRDPDALKPGEKPGTTPPEMVVWLEKNGFTAQLEFENKGDGSALKKLRDNIRRGVPTIVEWIDLAGHWVVAVGYDDRNNTNPQDDVLVFADPYDRYDDYPDGYTFVNAERFYWMWFDARYFGQETWRTMITVTPRP
jgi:hypothetical protein